MAVGVDLEHFLAVGVAPKPLAQPQKSAAITLNLKEDLRVEVFGVYLPWVRLSKKCSASGSFQRI